jgi:hypothetical protein
MTWCQQPAAGVSLHLNDCEILKITFSFFSRGEIDGRFEIGLGCIVPYVLTIRQHIIITFDVMKLLQSEQHR